MTPRDLAIKYQQEAELYYRLYERALEKQNMPEAISYQDKCEIASLGANIWLEEVLGLE